MRRFANLIMLCLLTGCSQQEETFEVVPVKGTVTLDGEPLPNAHIGFQPIATGKDTKVGTSSFGTTDAQGQFELKLATGGLGAVVGKHQVRVSTAKVEDVTQDTVDESAREALPAEYNTATKLTFEVKPRVGETIQSAKFDLKSKPDTASE